MVDSASKGRQVCRIHIDFSAQQTTAYQNCVFECEQLCVQEWLWGGLGAARGKLEGREQANTGEEGEGGQMVWMTAAATAVRMCEMCE